MVRESPPSTTSPSRHRSARNGASKRMAKAVATILFPALVVFGNSSASPIDEGLPEGPGVEVVRRDCLVCHDSRLIVEQRLSQAGWKREVDKMIGWGAEVPAEDRDRLIDYLAAHFTARKSVRAASTLPRAAGFEIVNKACLTCHDGVLIIQQRLTKSGWTREVGKMIRWGAELNDEERERLIEYLARHFPSVPRAQ